MEIVSIVNFGNVGGRHDASRPTAKTEPAPLPRRYGGHRRYCVYGLRSEPRHRNVPYGSLIEYTASHLTALENRPLVQMDSGKHIPVNHNKRFVRLTGNMFRP